MDFEEIPKPPEHVVRYAMGLVSGPCIAMIILGFAVRVSEPPVLFVASMQHLAAGIVLSAVAVELVPVITDAESTAGNIAGITLGFVFGVALFLMVGKFCEGDDDCDHGHDHSHEHAPPQRQLSRRKSLGQSKSKIGMMKQLSGMDGSAGKSYQAVAEAGTATIQGTPAYPTTMVLAVLVDAAVDGFLIGISAASGTNAGLIMAIAIALTIEMGFLSLTFAASLKKQKHSVFLVSILLPPLSLWLGGFIGATTAAAVARAPAMHVALISFGIAALLFLVTEELLLEAHEAQEHSAHEEHIWWVDMFFFLGFLLSFLMDKLLDTD